MGIKITGNFKGNALKGEKHKEKIEFDDFLFLDKSCTPQSRPSLSGGQNVEKVDMGLKNSEISK